MKETETGLVVPDHVDVPAKPKPKPNHVIAEYFVRISVLDKCLSGSNEKMQVCQIAMGDQMDPPRLLGKQSRKHWARFLRSVMRDTPDVAEVGR